MSTKDLGRSLKGVVFFIDRSSGKEVARAFTQHGVNVELHDDHFSQNTPDVDWLTRASGKFILSSNRRIKNNSFERDALYNASVGAFFFTQGDWNTGEKLAALEKGLPKIAKLVLNQQRPFIARIYKDGRIELWLDHKRRDLLAKKQAKGRK